MRLVIVTSALIAGLLQATVWYVAQQVAQPPDYNGKIASLSLAYEPHRPPFTGREPTLEGLDRDVRLIANIAKKVRVYSALDNLAAVPGIAERYNLDVTLGVWLDDERDAAGNLIPEIRKTNQEGIDAAIKLAREHWNVRELLIGNEVLLRAPVAFPDITDPATDETKPSPEAYRQMHDLIDYIRQAKAQTTKQVSTSEAWLEWTLFPDLVKEVDFITTHNLPFWEQQRADKAVEYALDKYDLLRNLYPGKRVLIGEFGWPSQGYNRMAAIPNPLKQAQVLREFLIEAERRGIEYNIVEAFDQPWKTFEASNAGPYWGIYDVGRRSKFPLSGPVEEVRLGVAGGGLLIGMFITIRGLRRRRPTFGHALAYAVAANAMSAGIMSAAVYPLRLLPQSRFMGHVGHRFPHGSALGHHHPFKGP